MSKINTNNLETFKEEKNTPKPNNEIKNKILQHTFTYFVFVQAESIRALTRMAAFKIDTSAPLATSRRVYALIDI